MGAPLPPSHPARLDVDYVRTRLWGAELQSAARHEGWRDAARLARHVHLFHGLLIDCGERLLRRYLAGE